MLRVVLFLLSGLIFGMGLTVSGMINPAKVLAFLDVAGDWDPSLAFVMAGAIPVAAIGFALGRRRATPLCAPEFHPPQATNITVRLCVGAILFGLGWGLVGFCPGPALASLGITTNGVVFVVAMLGGMVLFALTDGRSSRASR